MVSGFEIEGSMVIDVKGDRLDAYFISRYGDLLDQFRIEKVTNLPLLGPAAMIVLGLAMVLSTRFARRRSALNHPRS